MKRYDLGWDIFLSVPIVKEYENGIWCKHEDVDDLLEKLATAANNARFYSDKCYEMEKLLMEVTDCSASMALKNWFTRRDELLK